jgi:hypothetical protein
VPPSGGDRRRAHRRLGGVLERRGCLGEQEDHLGYPAPTQANAITVGQRVLFHLLLIDEGPVARAPITEHEGAGISDDLGVVARDFAAGQMEIAVHPPAHGELFLADRDDTSTQRVGDF